MTAYFLKDVKVYMTTYQLQNFGLQSQENNSCPLQREDWGRGGGRSEWFSHTAKAT